MNQQQEREALEKLLADTTLLRNAYAERTKDAHTMEQWQKMQTRLTRYEAVRVLIGDLMMG